VEAILKSFRIAGIKIHIIYCVTKEDGSRVHVCTRYAYESETMLENMEQRKPERVEVNPCYCTVFTLPKNLEYAIEE
jgi:hypothetical protein